MAKTLKIEKTSKVILFLMVAMIAILTAINYFVGEWGTLQYIAPALVFGTALFVFGEVGYFGGFKKKDIWRIGGAIVALVAMLGVLIELIPAIPSIQVLDTMKGFISAFLALYFVVEGFR